MDHPSIVRFLGLCRRAGLYGDALKEAFIVQEWCGSNLRSLIEAFQNVGVSGVGPANSTHIAGAAALKHEDAFLLRCVCSACSGDGRWLVGWLVVLVGRSGLACGGVLLGTGSRRMILLAIFFRNCLHFPFATQLTD